VSTLTPENLRWMEFVKANSLTNFVTGDVTMTSANTFYDGPSLALGVGTWLIRSAVTITLGGTLAALTAKLWDGTTAYAGVEVKNAASTVACLYPGTIVTLAAAATLKVSAAATATGCFIKATAPDNGTGITNMASYLTAMRLA
jgi:hypothetical protein